MKRGVRAGGQSNPTSQAIPDATKMPKAVVSTKRITKRKNFTPEPQNESASNSARKDNVQNEESSLPSHPTDEELLHAMLECPRVLDHLTKTSPERLRIERCCPSGNPLVVLI
jgi:hypothetical protein